MMTQKLIRNVALLASFAALTACPSKQDPHVNVPIPNQAQIGPGGNNPGGNNPGGNNPGGNNPGGDNIGSQPVSSIRSFQCEFEGSRSKTRKYFSSSINIPKTVSLITLDGLYETKIDLRTKFLGFDIGKFGKISMQFVPAAKTKSGTDTIILIDDGVNKNMRMSQSGFAGQMTRLEAQEDGMNVSVSCKGTSPFKSGTAHTGKTNLVCKGRSSTAVTAEELVNVSIPLNSIKAGEEFVISEAVSAKLDAAATTITYSGSLDPEYGAMVTSTASLKSSATFRLIDTTTSATEINITCGIQ